MVLKLKAESNASKSDPKEMKIIRYRKWNVQHFADKRGCLDLAVPSLRHQAAKCSSHCVWGDTGPAHMLLGSWLCCGMLTTLLVDYEWLRWVLKPLSLLPFPSSFYKAA